MKKARILVVEDEAIIAKDIRRRLEKQGYEVSATVSTGGEAVLAALEKSTGKDIWRTPNTGKLLLAHASVMPATIAGVIDSSFV